MAYDEIVEKRGKRTGGFFEVSTPIYEYFGKNKKRKKIKYWELKDQTEKDRSWFSEWRRLEEELLETSDIIIRPSMRIEQYDWCRGVDICLPIEVVDQKSLEDLADIVRSILRGEKKFEDFYQEDYKYGCDEWLADMNTFKESVDERICSLSC
jgi:hypothetical protein